MLSPSSLGAAWRLSFDRLRDQFQAFVEKGSSPKHCHTQPLGVAACPRSSIEPRTKTNSSAGFGARCCSTPTAIRNSRAWRGWVPCLKSGRRPVLFDTSEVREAQR